MYPNETSGERQAITDLFGHDHEQLDRKFEKYRELKEHDFPEAKEYFFSFYEELNRHIEWEENVLFPMLEEAIGEGLTGTMRVEHDQILEILDELHDTVQQNEATCDETEEKLLKFLEPHNDSEETIVYPAVDKHLNEKQIESIFEAIN